MISSGNAGIPNHDRINLSFTEPQLEVIKLAAQHISQADIARQLGISTKAVASRVTGALNRVGALNIVDLVRIAKERGCL